MNQEAKDQGWQRLESRIDQMIGRFLKEDYPAIEFKTNIAGLLQSPPEYNKQHAEKMS
jgi:hypothetical protein